MTENSKTLFSDGEDEYDSVLNVPSGEVARQAVNALRGYVYQIYQSLLAWIDLSANETLHLEVAEDYSVVAKGAITAVQVKDTRESGSMTLHSKSIQKAIQSFWNIQLANPRKVVRFRYLSTSPIGLERGLTFPNGRGGLSHWRHAARENSDVTTLRHALERIAFSDDLNRFIAKAAENDLRDNLLGRISWDCGAEDVAGLDISIRDRLIYLGETFGYAPSDSERARDTLIAHILSVITHPIVRQLSRADLLRVFEKSVSVSIPLSALRKNLSRGFVLSDGLAPGSISKAASIVDSVLRLPLPPRIITRRILVERCLADLANTGALWLHGSSGLGKTVLAQLIARQSHSEYLSLIFAERPMTNSITGCARPPWRLRPLTLEG